MRYARAGCAEHTFEHMTKCGFYDNEWKEEYRRNPRELTKYIHQKSKRGEDEEMEGSAILGPGSQGISTVEVKLMNPNRTFGIFARCYH